MFRDVADVVARRGLQIHILGNSRRVRVGGQRHGGDCCRAKVRVIDGTNVVVRIVGVCRVLMGRDRVRGKRERRSRRGVGARRDERRDGEHGDGNVAILERREWHVA